MSNSAPVDTTSTPTTTTTTTPTCQHCGKAESALNHSLKTCAKCKTAKYCSRDCQKSDFKSHKRACRAAAAANFHNSPAFDRPSDEELLKEATTACDLLVALVSSPDHRNASLARPEPPILQHLIGFISRTMAEYWTPLLPMRRALELSARFQDDPVEYMEERTKLMPEWEQKGIHVDTWPPFDRELYSDAIGRGVMAQMIVIDDAKQCLFGMPPGVVYNWSDAVREEVRKQRSERHGSA